MASRLKEANRRRLWFHLGVGVSFANFAHYVILRHLSFATTRTLYYNPPVERLDRVAALINIVLLTLLCCAATFWAEATRHSVVRRALRWAFIIALLFVLDSIRRSVFIQIPSLLRVIVYLSSDTGLPGKALLFGTTAVVVAATLRFETQIVRGIYRILVFLIPFCALVLFPMFYQLVAAPEPELPSAVSHATLNASGDRNESVKALWLVWDELDRRLLDPTADARSPYPNIEAFRNEATEFGSAASPGYNTMESLPSLITGVRVRSAKPVSATDLELRFDDGTVKLWREASTVFGDAHEYGLRANLIGWAHPYSRAISPALDYCRWYVVDPVPFGEPGSLWSRQRNQLAWLSPWNRLGRYADRFEDFRASFLRRVREDFEPGSGVVMLAHIPIPHLPSIYDARRERYSVVPRSRANAYANNMVLVDKTFGEIRQALAANGVWDETLVVFSSDHGEMDGSVGHRTDRVPFIVKLPGQRVKWTVDAPVNTVVTRAMIRAVANGEIETPSDLESWIEGNGASARKP